MTNVNSMRNRISFDCANNAEITVARNSNTGSVSISAIYHYQDGSSSVGGALSPDQVRYLKMFLNEEGPYSST